MGRIRKITVITVSTGSLVLGLTGVTLASEGGAHAGAKSTSASTQTQVISYLGYQMKVPASWPVYRLATDPSRCVLFNRHAVYLGSPGTDQRCPSSAVGKTEALLVQPLGSNASVPPQTSVQEGNTVEMPSGKQATQAAASQTVRLALPKAGVVVTASYGHDPSLIRGILGSAHLTSVSQSAIRRAEQASAGPDRPWHATASGSPAHRSPAHRSPAHRSPAHHQARHGQARQTAASRARSTTPAQSPQAAAAASSGTLTGVTGAGLGFDTCTVPSVATMKSWLASPFRMVGTYLGGDNWACNYGNFNQSWVSQVAAMGWRFIPLWVGPQAPCTNATGVVTINASDAFGEGWSQATSAVSTAASFGYGRGSPIYFDMEGYDNLNRSCSSAVLSFLSGWTRSLHRAGYRSGVYSSASSGITDLAGQYRNSGYTEPDDIWYAQWDGNAVVTNGGLPSGDWPGYRRLHQFDGPNVETFGGVSVNIDDDYVAGDVAGLGAPPGAYALAQPDAVRVAPGSSAQATVVITAPAGQGARQTVQWQVQQANGVSVTPDAGTAVVAPGDSVSLGVEVRASSSAPSVRDSLTVSASSAGQPSSSTALLVSVTSRTLTTPHPVVLYAASRSDMAAAVQLERDFALPSSALTGNLSTAWRDAATGKDIVIAIGHAALNGLYSNPCGWSNPDHRRAGSTPFIDLGGPLNWPPGHIYFENAAGANQDQSNQLTAALLKYALTGTLPSPHAVPAAPIMPTSTCIR